MRRRSAFAMLLLCAGTGGVLRAQSAADSASYTWLLHAAHTAADSGEFNPDHDQRTAQYRRAEQYARRAVAANPSNAAGHFELARALGRAALSVGTRERIRYATAVRSEALAALEIDPKHAGALHVMGEWNAEVMRLNGLSRMIARNFLGGAVFGEASWDNAQRYLEQAAAIEPHRILHRLDLAAVYVDRDQKAKAIEQYELIARTPAADVNDAKYKELAAARLKELQ